MEVKVLLESGAFGRAAVPFGALKGENKDSTIADIAVASNSGQNKENS